MNYRVIPTKSLPSVIKRVLAEVRFTKRKIGVSIANQYSMYSAGDDGAKGFSAVVNLDTNQYQVVWGAFGGGGLSVQRSPVDDVNTPRKPLQDHLVVVNGQVGGRDPYASLTCTASCYEVLSGGSKTAGKRASGSGSANARYLASLPSTQRNAILKAVATHYGISPAEAQEELEDRDAEAVYEYLAANRSLASQVYNDFHRKKYAKTFGQARAEIFEYLKSEGWEVRDFDMRRMKPMKEPWAKSPDKQDTLFFKAQAVYLNAHSLFVDIRTMSPQQFLKEVEKFRGTKW